MTKGPRKSRLKLDRNELASAIRRFSLANANSNLTQRLAVSNSAQAGFEEPSVECRSYQKQSHLEISKPNPVGL